MICGWNVVSVALDLDRPHHFVHRCGRCVGGATHVACVLGAAQAGRRAQVLKSMRRTLVPLPSWRISSPPQHTHKMGPAPVAAPTSRRAQWGACAQAPAPGPVAGRKSCAVPCPCSCGGPAVVGQGQTVGVKGWPGVDGQKKCAVPCPCSCGGPAVEGQGQAVGVEGWPGVNGRGSCVHYILQL